MATIFRDSRTELRRPPLGLERLRLRGAPAPPPPAPSKPNQIDLVSALVSKFGVSEGTASAFIAMLHKAKAQAPVPYVLSAVDWRQFHSLLELAIPSERRLRLLIGHEVDHSAHDLLNRALLDEGQTFKHGMTEDQCSVTVRIA